MAHPRLRGAHLERGADALESRGSSPLTRGAPMISAMNSLVMGLIPAYAGRTAHLTTRVRCRRAHPRLRGAHQKGGVGKSTTVGSSPLTRGARNQRIGGLDPVGLIPAYAGRTPACSEPTGWLPAHPRLRGAHRSRSQSRTVYRGSSPLTRGAHASGLVRLTVEGLIPAYAGRTRLTLAFRAASWAHPRLRGAHLEEPETPNPFWGSSPLTRGAPH